jgi:hypothetical protein
MAQTKEQLEFEAKAREKEKARLAKAAAPARITAPENVPRQRAETPQDRTRKAIAGGVSRVGTSIAESLAAAGATGAYDRNRDLPSQGVKTPEQLGQVPISARGAGIDGVNSAGTIQRSPENVLQNTFLREQGITPAVQGQDPRVFDAEGTGRDQRRQRIGAGGQEFVNLGKFETEGGPNIFGRASEAGGPINTFVGAGRADPNDPSQVVGQGAAQAGGRFGEGFRETSVDPELQRGIDAFKLRAAGGGNLRAGDKQFRGGAAGGGDQTLRAITAINRRANKAFEDALGAGMNTKAAARIAGSIRDGATQINFQDRTQATERNTAATIEGQKEIAELRNISARETLDAEQARALDDASFEDLKGLSYTPNPETGVMEFNQQQFSESLFAAGGRDALAGFSGTTKHALFRQGSNVRKFISNANEYLAKEGKRVDNVGDMLKGANLTKGGKLAQTHTTLMQALRDKNIDITDIFGETLTLGDGTLLPLSALLGEDAAQFTADERAALIEIIPED